MALPCKVRKKPNIHAPGRLPGGDEFPSKSSYRKSKTVSRKWWNQGHFRGTRQASVRLCLGARTVHDYLHWRFAPITGGCGRSRPVFTQPTWRIAMQKRHATFAIEFPAHLRDLLQIGVSSLFNILCSPFLLFRILLYRTPPSI